MRLPVIDASPGPLVRPVHRILSLAVGLVAVGVAAASSGGEGVLSEEAALRVALQENPALQAARHELEAARIAAGRGRPERVPELIASISQSVRTPRVDLPGRPDEVFLPNARSRFTLVARQPLYQFGVGRAPWQRADALSAAAEGEYRRAELDLLLEAREAYLDLQRALGAAEAAALGVDLARENLRITRASRDAGFQADVDVLEAERGVAEAEEGQVRSAAGIRLAKANLNRVLGRALNEEVTVEPLAPEPPAPPPLAELEPVARERRPELAVLRRNAEAAAAGIRLARASGLPRIDFEVGLALQTRTALQDRHDFGAGVTVTIPILPRSQLRATVREAEERLEQLRAAARARESGISLEIERQRLAYDEAAAARRSALARRALAEKELEVTRLRLSRGHAIQLELQAKRVALVQAETDARRAVADAHLARIRLDRALGLPELTSRPPSPPN